MQATIEQLANPEWRLNNLYYCKDQFGKKVKFKFNWMQRRLYNRLWFLNLILKARQLGCTTFIQIFILDRCLFNSNVNAGIIAHNRKDAQKFFEDKIKFAYNNLPSLLKDRVRIVNDSTEVIKFSNGSSIVVGTSLRSGSYQYLHISEFGKLCSLFTARAQEVITGALNTVAAGQFVFIESTADGPFGSFFDLCQTYKGCIDRKMLTPMDYRFWFFPWWEDSRYQLDIKLEVPNHLVEYFKELEIANGIKLTDKQKAWYVKKEKTQRLKMRQEYPSTADEAFEQLSEYSVYGKELGKVIVEGRRIDLPVDHEKPTYLFFDLGRSLNTETTATWFMQHNDPWYDFIDFYQSKLKSVNAYVKDIKQKGYHISKWYIPHDGGDTNQDYDLKTFKSRLVEAGIDENDIIVVSKIDNLRTGIDLTKEKFPYCRFDKTRTELGWSALCNYRYQYDEQRAVLKEPVHNWASHPSDGFRQFAQGFESHTDRPQPELNYRTKAVV